MAYGDIVLNRQGKICMATNIRGNHPLIGKILINPYFVRLDNVSMFLWNRTRTGEISSESSCSWMYDFSVSYNLQYDPPSMSGVKSDGKITYFPCESVQLQPYGDVSWLYTKVTPLADAWFEGIGRAKYIASGSNVRIESISNASIVGFQIVPVWLYHYELRQRVGRQENASVAIKKADASSLKNEGLRGIVSEEGDYVVVANVIVKFDFNYSDTNSGMYTLDESNTTYVEWWIKNQGRTLYEGKKTSFTGTIFETESVSIPFHVSKNDEGKLIVDYVQDEVEIGIGKQKYFSINQGFINGVYIGSGHFSIPKWCAKFKVKDLFTISLQEENQS